MAGKLLEYLDKLYDKNDGRYLYYIIYLFNLINTKWSFRILRWVNSTYKNSLMVLKNKLKINFIIQR